MNNLDIQYQSLLKDIMENGVKKKTRNGETLSLFGKQIRHRMSDGFPLLTTKKMYFKGVVTELLWFLRGDTNIKYLVDNDCHIWDGDAYKRFLNETIRIEPTEVKERAIIQLLNSKESKEEFINKIKTDDEFAKKWGDLGKIYGYQWRNWNGHIDQISELVKELKENPNSRRLLVSAWNPSDLPNQVLPPCHYGFQCYVRDGKYLSLMWHQRSCDFFLGAPFNIASYGLLLEIIAKEVNMIPDELIGNLGDTHLYSNHIEQAKEQIARPPFLFELPKLIINNEFWNPDSSIINQIEYIVSDDFIIENYQSHPAIKAPLSN